MVRMATQRGTGTDSTRLTLSEHVSETFPGLTLIEKLSVHCIYRLPSRTVRLVQSAVPVETRALRTIMINVYGESLFRNYFLCSGGIPNSITISNTLYSQVLRDRGQTGATPRIPHPVPRIIRNYDHTKVKFSL